MIVHNNFIKKNGSISDLAQTIIDNFSARALVFQEKTGFVGMTSNISESGDTLTISLEWTSPEERRTVLTQTDVNTYVEQLNSFCIANAIIKTKEIA